MVKRVRSGVSAAEKSEMPGFIKPQLATLRARAPKGDQWLHEIKFDGYALDTTATPQIATISECRYRWLRVQDLNLLRYCSS